MNASSAGFQPWKSLSRIDFSGLQRLYSYDKTPLHDVVESTHPSNELETVEKITLDAAYGERARYRLSLLAQSGALRSRPWCTFLALALFSTLQLQLEHAYWRTSISLSRAAAPLCFLFTKEPSSALG